MVFHRRRILLTVACLRDLYFMRQIAKHRPEPLNWDEYKSIAFRLLVLLLTLASFLMGDTFRGILPMMAMFLFVETCHDMRCNEWALTTVLMDETKRIEKTVSQEEALH